MDNYTFTIAVYTSVLIVFLLSYSFYFRTTMNSYEGICEKPLWKDFRFIVPCLFYGLVLGFRYDYAWDWDQYRQTFEYLQNGDLFRDNTEKGYLVINQILIFFGFNYYSIFILEGLVYVFSLCYLLKDNRKLWITAIPIIYVINSFNCLNISRQYFAMSLFFIAFRFLLDGKKKAYIISSAIAISVHTAVAPFCVLFYFYKYLDRLNLRLTYALGCYLLCIFFQQYFFSNLIESASWLQENIITNKTYADIMMDEKYLREMLEGKQFFYKIIMQLSYIGLYFYVCKKDLLSVFRNKKSIDIFLVIGLVALYLEVIAGAHELTSRFFYTTSIFTQIGWGIIVYTILRHIKSVSPLATLMVLFYILRTIMSFYVNIYTSMILNHFFIEYK